MRLKDLQATAAIVLLLISGSTQPALAQAGGAPSGAPQQTQTSATAPAPQPPTGADQSNLPSVPAPKLTEPLYLRDTGVDYTHQHPFFPNPLKLYTPIDVGAPRLGNTPRLGSLLRDGKIYLSLSDAVLLALENNFDIAIARINLDIADTDILRAKAGSGLRGVSTGLVAGTLGSSGSTVTGGGGPGGTSSSSRWRQHRRQWSGAQHDKQWRSDAGEPRSYADQLPGIQKRRTSSNRICSFQRWQVGLVHDRYRDIQLRLSTRVSDRHPTGSA